MAIKFLDDEPTEVLETTEPKKSSIRFLEDEPEKQDGIVKQEEPKRYSVADNIAEATVLAPIREIGRGFASGVSSLYGALDTVANLSDTLSGRDKKFNLFQKWSDQTKQDAENIQESRTPEFSNAIFQTAGATVPILTEFAMVPGGEVAKFAVSQAVSEYRNSGEPLDPTSLITGGIKGGVTGALAGPVIEKGIEIIKSVGKSAAKTYIKFVTGSEKIADDFVNNVNKYSLSKKGVKSLEEVKKANDIKRATLKSEIKSDIEIVKAKNLRQQQIADGQMKDATFKHREANAEVTKALASNNAQAVEAATNKSVQAIKESTSVLNSKATVTMDNALAEYKAVRKRLGDNVGNAISESAPGATVPYSSVSSRVSKTLEKSPFKIEERLVAGKKGILPTKKFKSRTAISADSADVKNLNNLVREIKSYESEGFPVEYLQNLKNAARDQAGKAYKTGNRELGNMYSQLAKDVNPAEIVSSSSSLSKQFPGIAEANKNFSSMIKKYETAMDMYYTKNALGEYVPDVNKALNKIASGDTVAIRQMKLADQALPKDSQIFPKVQGLINDAEKVATEHKATIKSLKRRFKAEKQAVDKAQKQATYNLNKKQTRIKQERKVALGENIKNYTETKNKIYESVDNKLTKMEEFYEAQEMLNRVAAPSGTAGLVQHLLGFGGILPMLTGQFSARTTASALGFAALSPKIAALVTKSGINSGATLNRIISPVIKNKNLQKVIIKRIQDN